MRYTIRTSRQYGRAHQFFGAFDTIDDAIQSMDLMAPAVTPNGTSLDVVPIPAGCTPKHLHPEFRAS